MSDSKVLRKLIDKKRKSKELKVNSLGDINKLLAKAKESNKKEK